MNNLIWCPFCGSDVTAIGSSRNGYRANCLNCDVHEYFENKEDAMTHWNRRMSKVKRIWILTKSRIRYLLKKRGK